MLEFKTTKPEETREIGKAMGCLLKGGDVVGLTGELGAGKTVFIKGLAEGLGVPDFVSSPTFIIMNEYNGRMPFFHVDLYRLENNREIEELALDEYFGRDGVVAIEWAEKLGDRMPQKSINVKIEHSGERERKIRIWENGLRRLGDDFWKSGK
jgi:tRNA threonylcarbamoyladenosine biosynthesis protein TsaE